MGDGYDMLKTMTGGMDPLAIIKVTMHGFSYEKDGRMHYCDAAHSRFDYGAKMIKDGWSGWSAPFDALDDMWFIGRRD